LMNWIPPPGSLTENPPEISVRGAGTEFISNSEEETFYIGKKIAGILTNGSIVALSGTLGSGKTCLAKGIACGLGIGETITSPTYTIISEYSLPNLTGKKWHTNQPVLYHIDAYRLDNEEDFEQIGGSEIINSGGIIIIEWSERIKKSLPDKIISITLEISGPASRVIKVKEQM